jgi:hypothetical protein
VAPGRVRNVVSHVDVAPTLLELAGIPPLDESSGISLVQHLRNGAPLPPRSVLTDIGAEVTAYDDDGHLTVRIARAETGPDASDEERARATRAQKLAWQRFDRTHSTGALADTVTKRDGTLLPADVVAYLSAETPLVPALPMSDFDVERLRALGYLEPEDGENERDVPRTQGDRDRAGAR